MSKWEELKLAAERLKAGVQDAESFDEHQTLMTLYSMSFREQANPAAVLELIAENERLRQIIINSSKEVGAALSTECSLEFMERLPQEIWLVMQRQQDGADQLTAELAELRALSGGKR